MAKSRTIRSRDFSRRRSASFTSISVAAFLEVTSHAADPCANSHLRPPRLRTGSTQVALASYRKRVSVRLPLSWRLLRRCSRRSTVTLPNRFLAMSLALALCSLAISSVLAQGRGHVGGGYASGGHAPTHLDGRFGHGHSYYDHGGARLSYDRSHWYRRDHGRTIIIGAPFGAFVPFLPWYYSTIWWDGLPYYYANDTYYTWNADQDQYEVVEPPAGIESEAKLAPAIGDLFVYPKNGQTDDQKMHDEADC